MTVRNHVRNPLGVPTGTNLSVSLYAKGRSPEQPEPSVPVGTPAIDQDFRGGRGEPADLPHSPIGRGHALTVDPADLVTASHVDAGDVLAWRMRRIEPIWMRNANCRVPEHRGVDFFAAGKAGQQAALAVCGGCPVLLPCRRWALNPDHPLTDGVAGGMTAAARRLTIRRKSEPTNGSSTNAVR